MMKKIFLVGGIFLFLVFSSVSAENSLVLNNYKINLNLETIKKGYTVSALGDKIKLSLIPGVLSSSTDIEVLNLNNEPIATSSDFDLISDIYQFEFKNKQAYDNHTPFYIQLSYNKTDNRRKELFFYNKPTNKWVPLPTTDYPDKNFVRSLIHLPYARIAVMSYPGTLTVGKTSWYSYKKGNFAASPDFPIGSKLRIRSVSNNKFVDVIVNDFGPDRKIHTDRVVDLDKVAFQALAPLGAGVINVTVEPLHIASDKEKTAFIASMAQKTEEPAPIEDVVEKTTTNKVALDEKIDMNLTVKSAIAINEKTGNVIWEKDSKISLPLASLTKLVSAKVFLDTNPNLNEIVTYSDQDLQNNHKYVGPTDAIATLKVVDGEQMTIENLLYSALVGSANNAVESLVRVSGLSRDEFISRMNAYVNKIGANDSHFEEPTGLSPQNVSSVSDYALITKTVLKNATIKKISSTFDYEFYTINTKKYHHLKNTNKLIASNKYNITGSKTGYLEEAGYCLMTRVKSGTQNIIVVTFGADTRAKSFSETEKLIKYSLKNINT